MIGESDPCAGEVLNIGSEREVNMLQLAELMMKVAGMEGAIELHPSPEGSVLRRRPDISKLKRLTGFAETTTLEQGLELTSQFYLNGILPPAR